MLREEGRASVATGTEGKRALGTSTACATEAAAASTASAEATTAAAAASATEATAAAAAGSTAATAAKYATTRHDSVLREVLRVGSVVCQH